MSRAAIGIALLCAACGGSDVVGSDGGSDGGACPAYVVPAGTDLTAPRQSLGDVMKLFNDSCGSSTCHGSATAPMGGLFLGSEDAHGSDGASVRARLVGVAAQELPSMALVTAGDPGASYIMHKLDGDQCRFAGRCSGGGDCGVLMPADSAQPLPQATRDILRRWIAQGAPAD